MLQDTYILQLPKKQLFYSNLGTTMTFYSLGNRTWWGYKAPNKFLLFHRYLTLVCAPICIVSQVIYLALYYKTLSFITLSTIFAIFPVGCVTNKAINVEHYTRWMAYFLMVCLMADWALWVLMPLLHFSQNVEEIKNQTVMLQTLLHFWMPFDYAYNIRNWAIIHIVNSYVAFSACAIVIIYNTLNYIFLFHLIGHIQIWKHRFKTEFSENLNSHTTKEKLASFIKSHSFIVEVFKDVQDAFGYNVTANYCHNLLSDSFLLYQIMFGDKEEWMVYGLMFLVYLGGLILMSMVLEEMRRQSDDMADVVYSIPWERMSISNQKTFMMMLARTQPALEFISAGGLRAGVRPTLSIIKSTFSYYVMLKTSMKVDE